MRHSLFITANMLMCLYIHANTPIVITILIKCLNKICTFKNTHREFLITTITAETETEKLLLERVVQLNYCQGCTRKVGHREAIPSYIFKINYILLILSDCSH